MKHNTCKKFSLIAAGLLLGSTTLVGGSIAFAEDPASSPALTGHAISTDVLHPGESETVVISDGTTMTLEVGEAEVVDETKIEADAALSPIQKSELMAAAKAAAAKSTRHSAQ